MKMPETKIIRVMLVDDHTVVRSGLSAFLLAYDDLELVGEASSGERAIQLWQQTQPDVVLMDMMMPDMTGFEVIEKIKFHERLSDIPILVCTANKFVRQKKLENVEGICYKPIDIESILAKVNSLIACCDRAELSQNTLVIDVGEEDPLYQEYQKLVSDYDNNCLMQNLLDRGYEIFKIHSCWEICNYKYIQLEILDYNFSLAATTSIFY